ncbi:MAG: iron-containing alcohol dehydrogenase [Chloroflexi bacterium]|nr:iron-containing alcohol dehydrogenase [Chloroflexota bacterium]MCI0825304.1 iron-containing alcohol dehydrogenase [Chloroflexota bacterium]
MATANPFRFAGYPIRIHAGEGAIAQLGDEAGRARVERVFVVCGQTVAHRTDLLDRVRDALGERLAGVFDGTEAASPLPSVERGVAMAADAGADAIVALGGGSAVVTTRAIVILLAEGGTAHDHATKYPPGQPPVSPRLMKPKIPNFVVLTTPTTAATRAGTAVLDPDTGHRLELFDPKTRPAAMFWDTAALETASPSLCLSAAGSCFSGVIAALQSKARPNPLAEGDLLQALLLLQENLPVVHSGTGSADARVNLCAAAYLSNRASDSSGGSGSLAVVTSLAHSLDSRYPECSHGAAYSILTAPGMRFNAEYNLDGQARLASLLGVALKGTDQRAQAKAAASSVGDTYLSLGMPSRLSEVGVTEQGISEIAQDSMTDFAIHRNLRPVEDAAQLEELLRKIW